MVLEALAVLMLAAPQEAPAPPAASPPETAPAAASAAPSPAALTITLLHDDEPSRATRDQLQRLLGQFPLQRWFFTTTIQIDSSPGVIPHSHPVLTLNTGSVHDDELLVATFVHEQLHWYLVGNREASSKADAALRKLFPEAPGGPPEGARDLDSTYRHLMVCYFEYQALRELLGELRARWVIDYWAHHHYQWVYRTVLERGREIGKIVREAGLQP